MAGENGDNVEDVEIDQDGNDGRNKYLGFEANLGHFQIRPSVLVRDPSCSTLTTTTTTTTSRPGRWRTPTVRTTLATRMVACRRGPRIMTRQV